jgi:hypothetical protein
MWKNLVQPDGPQMTKWRTRIACWLIACLVDSLLLPLVRPDNISTNMKTAHSIGHFALTAQS